MDGPLNYIIVKKAKTFEVDKIDLAKQALAISDKFDGLNFNGRFIDFVFTSEPTQEEKDAVDALWGGLTEEAEAVKLALPSRLGPSAMAELLATKKAALASKTWDQMSSVERKLAMGLQLTNEEIDGL